MPVVQANGIDINYEVQGAGEPLVLIPYLAADQACYAFQVADYAKEFTCFTVDLRGAGLSGKPDGDYSTELLAEDIAAFMQAASRRYPSIHYWMIWGEVTRSGNFNPMPPNSPVGPQRYAALLDAAYGALKAVNRTVAVTTARIAANVTAQPCQVTGVAP